MPESITFEQLLALINNDLLLALQKYKGSIIASGVIRELVNHLDSLAVQKFLSQYQDVPSRILAQLVNESNDHEVLTAVANHIRTPKDSLQQLAQHDSVDIRIVIAANRQISPNVATLLTEDKSVLVRLNLAENQCISQRIQGDLARDPSPLVRTSLLKQKHLPKDIFQQLCDDPDFFVKARALIFGDASDDQLLSWVDSNDLHNQLFILLRKKLPSKVLEALTFSQHQSIQKRAIQGKELNNDELMGWAEHGDLVIRTMIAGQEKLPKTVQLFLCNDKEVVVRQTLAANSALCQQAAIALVQQPVMTTWQALASNPNIKENIILILANTGELEIHKLLSQRGDLSQEVVGKLLENGNETIAYHLSINSVFYSTLSANITEQFANSQLPTVRVLAAASDNISDTASLRLRLDPSVKVRRALVRNPQVDIEILKAMLNDHDKLVVSFAQDNLLGDKALDAQDATVLMEEGNEDEKSGFFQRILKRVIKN